MSAALALPDGVALYSEAYRAGWRPEPRLSVWEWADEHVWLTEVDSSEPGKFRSSRTPYIKEPSEALSVYHPAKRVVLMWGAQLGKTRMGLNWIGYTMAASPAPLLFVEPSLDMMKTVSKQRVAPMIEASPSLRTLVRDARTRDSGNTVLAKEYPGGMLLMTGANSAKGLKSMPVPRLLLDECDEYPGDVEGQGDPVALAEARTATFPLSKELLTSTPTLKGLSRVEREFNASNQKRFFLPCPHCGVFDWLRWERMRWSQENGLTIEQRAATAHAVCLSCEQRIDEHHKQEMLARGVWRATAAGDGRTEGYHLSSLYSPLGWRSWADCVRMWLEAKGDTFKLKTFVNTVLAETWEERGDAADADSLKKRRERYEGDVPEGVGILVGAADVQGNRIEAVVVGFGAGEESWLVDFEVFTGDPEKDAGVWYNLTEFFNRERTTKHGRKVRVARALVDSGEATERVYKWCKTMLTDGRGYYPCKGGAETGKPLVGRPSITNRLKVPLFVLCTDSGKEVVVSRLNIIARGPGRVHLPDWVDDEFIEQLAAEKGVRQWKRGRGTVRVWEKVRERNEALDLYVYALGALYVCGPAVVRTLAERAFKLAQPMAETKVEPASAPAEIVVKPDARRAPKPKRGGGWMDPYR